MKKVTALMWGIRKLTRSTLMLQHIIAEDMGLHVTDAECIDFLKEMGLPLREHLQKQPGLPRVRSRV